MENNYIVYIAGGLLGDFFSQLSVINENYLKYNKKGLLYITDIKNAFRNPLQRVYRDTYDVISQQDYIYEYKIYNNEGYDIDLSSWRKNPLLFKTNFYEVYKSEYTVDWGKHRWLTVPYEEKWKNIILINTVPYKFINNIDYDEYKSIYPKFKFVFISIEKDHYDFFISNTKRTDIDWYCPQSLYDTAIAINSCHFYIGNQSALLCIAYALHKRSLTIDAGDYMANLCHSDMQFLNTTYM